MTRAPDDSQPRVGPDPALGESGVVTRRGVLLGSASVLATLAVAGCSGNTAQQLAEGPPDDPTGPTRPSPTQPDPTQPSPTDGPSRDRPNILVILADDMGFSDIGCFGAEIRTPNLDALAAQGRVFTDMHNNSRCCPSRASLLTGLYPTQTGVGYMVVDQGSPAYQGYLNTSCVTLGEALGASGYRTAIAGKWHVAPAGRTEEWPALRGFERSYCQTEGGDYYTPNLYKDGVRIGSPSIPGYWLTTAVTDFAIQRIREYAPGPDPFFLYVGFKNPHYPLQAHPDQIAAYRGVFDDGWDELRRQRWEGTKAAGVVDPQWRLSNPTRDATPWADAEDEAWQTSRMEVYAAQVTELDTEVGRLLTALDETGARQNTLVVFLSDNGACAESPSPTKHAGEPTANGRPMRAGNIPGIFPGPSDTFQSYGMEWANVSNSPFRKYKRWVEEGGISSPMIAAWPGRLGSGMDHSFLHFIDVMPTLLDVAGASYPEDFNGNSITPVEGESFASLLRSTEPTSGWARSNACFWEHMGHRAARQGRWKIVSDRPTGRFELFDMIADRTETQDVSTAHPEIVNQLATGWDAWKQRVHVQTWHSARGYRRG